MNHCYDEFILGNIENIFVFSFIPQSYSDLQVGGGGRGGGDLLGAKPLTKPMRIYCQMDPKEQNPL